MTNSFKKKLTIKFLIYSLVISILPVAGIYITSAGYLIKMADFLTHTNRQLNQIVQEGVPTDESEISIEEVLINFDKASRQANESIEGIETTNYIILFLSLILVTLVALLVIVRIKGEFQFIEEGLLAISEQNFSKRLSSNRNDELGDIAREFNRMAKNLEEKEGILNYLLEENLFMQSIPKIPEVKIIANHLSNDGGRHFAYVNLPFKKLAFLIVDPVADKKLNLFLKNYFQFFFRHEFENYTRLDDFCNSLNQRLISIATKFHFFISAFCGVLDLKNYRLTFVNSGFKGAIYFSSNGKGIQSVSNQKSQAFGNQDKYVQKTLQLEARDKLLFFNKQLKFESTKQGYSIELANQNASQNKETIVESSFLELLKKLPSLVSDGKIGETSILFEMA